jgi:hypothetical protein
MLFPRDARSAPTAVEVPGRAALRAGARVGLHVGATAVTGWLVGSAIRSVAPERNAAWILGRASGLTCLLLLTVLALSGLVMSHPWRTRGRLPHPVSRVRLHVSLAVFTLALFVVHVVVLATDRWAHVGRGERCCRWPRTSGRSR